MGSAALVCFLQMVHATSFSHISALNDWIPNQLKIAKTALSQNISRPDAAKGSVVAATSRENPRYYFVWVRDAALVMDHIVTLYETSPDTTEREWAKQTLMDYVTFSRGNQLTDNPVGSHTDRGLGEVKFEASGAVFQEGWMRPQNDGPALRAKALTRFARILIERGEKHYVMKHLYSPDIPASTVIKADLEYVSHHWKEHSYDIWEETYGQHFYTLLVKRATLIEGGKLARSLGDRLAAKWYFEQAAAIEPKIVEHWNPDRGQIVTTLPHHHSAHKASGLDSADILAVLHADQNDDFFTVTDDRVLTTIVRQEALFRSIYPINHTADPDVEPAIGRTLEDIYNGYNMSGPSNPWVLTTLGFAEFYYRLHNALQEGGEFHITPRSLNFLKELSLPFEFMPYSTIRAGSNEFTSLLLALREKGDRFVNRVRKHSPTDGRWSEQMRRDNGYMAGAENLTWGFVSFLTAMHHREGRR